VLVLIIIFFLAQKVLILRFHPGIFAFLILSIFFISIGSIASAQSSDSNKAFATVQNSLALVLSSDGLGTAFCIFSDETHSVFLTNHHVVGSDKTVRMLVQGDTNKKFMADVVRVGEEPLDAAVLIINYPHIPYLRLSSKSPDIGRRIGIAGYPKSQLDFAMRRLGLSSSVHSGTISSFVANGYYLEFDAQVDHGNSGGPLFDAETGVVYGIVTYKVSENAQVNLAINISKFDEFLANAHASASYIDPSSAKLSYVSPVPSSQESSPLPSSEPVTSEPVTKSSDSSILSSKSLPYDSSLEISSSRLPYAIDATYFPYFDGFNRSLRCTDDSFFKISMVKYDVIPDWPYAMLVRYANISHNHYKEHSDIESNDFAGNGIFLGSVINGLYEPANPSIFLPNNPLENRSIRTHNGFRYYIGSETLEIGGVIYPNIHIFV